MMASVKSNEVHTFKKKKEKKAKKKRKKYISLWKMKYNDNNGVVILR